MFRFSGKKVTAEIFQQLIRIFEHKIYMAMSMPIRLGHYSDNLYYTSARHNELKNDLQMLVYKNKHKVLE